jgi:hypothetical protein
LPVFETPHSIGEEKEMTGQSPLSMMRPTGRDMRGKAAAGRARRRRWSILTPLAIVVALAVVWVGLWYYAATTADRTLAGWVEREAAAGRVYACGRETIGGFPLSIQAHCSDITAAIKDAQPPFAVKANAVTFAAEVYQPTRLTGDIVGPLTFAPLGGPPSLSANWTRAQVTISGVPPDPEGFSVRLTGAHLENVGNSSSTIFQAARADVQGRIAAGSPRSHPVIEMTVKLAAASAPFFHPALAKPIDLELDAVVLGFKDLSPKPWAVRFHELQAAGGEIEIKSLRIAQGDSIVVGAGKVTVNQNGRLDGLARVAVVGVEHIIPLLGFDRALAQGVDQLSGTEGAAAQGMSALDQLVPGLSGALRDSVNTSLVENLKKMGQPTTIDHRPATTLPLRFVNGAVYLGMLRIGEVPPLF